jgi:hypothetical protein
MRQNGGDGKAVSHFHEVRQATRVQLRVAKFAFGGSIIAQQLACAALQEQDVAELGDAGGDVQATLKRGREPEDGGNSGRLSDPLGLLWLADCFATRDRMERDRCS